MIRNSRILVTGANGFVGQHVCRELERYEPAEIIARDRGIFDLRSGNSTSELFRKTRPNVVIHLAAFVGGIEANRQEPGRIFYENAMMGLNVLEQCRLWEVAKVLTIGTVCSYPKHCPVPFHESDLFNGKPDETNAPYGEAKRALLTMGQAYRQQYGLNAIHLLLVNCYGPGDNTDPVTSHVIPALIRKVLEAKRTNAPFVECWGTGTASREFLYVEDAARAICLAADRYNGGEPVNIGIGDEWPISEVADEICQIIGYKGELRWDANKPDGQPRRKLEVSRAKEAFGFTAEICLESGLQRTVEWMKTQCQ